MIQGRQLALPAITPAEPAPAALLLPAVLAIQLGFECYLGATVSAWTATMNLDLLSVLPAITAAAHATLPPLA